MTRSHVAAAAAATGVEVITEVPALEGFMAAGVAGRGYGVAGAPVARAAVRRGVVYGAGAAAVGAYGYYGSTYNNCHRDAYGNTVCPQHY